MNIIIDAREHDTLDPLHFNDYGASEPLVMRVAKLLYGAGHKVDCVWKGDTEEVVEGIRWWPWNRHPEKCDLLVACEWLVYEGEFEYKRLIVPLNKINPILDGKEGQVNAFLVFSQEHKRQLLFYNPTIKEDQVAMIPPGVDVPPQVGPKVKNRLIWCNTPERGLVHLARAWPLILKKVPDATIAITYGVERSWEQNKWLMDNIAEELAEVRRWVKAYPESVISMGRVSPHSALIAEQCKAELYAYPADAPLPGIVHALAAMEVAAAGCGLLLSRLEGLPEVFADCADFLDIPINNKEWVEEISAILLDDVRKASMSKKARAWAKRQPWSGHAAAWRRLVTFQSAHWGVPQRVRERETADVSG